MSRIAQATSIERWARPGLLAALLAGFALRLQDLTLQNIWWDEARNIDVALRPFLHIATAPELDIHPPVYFWLLHLWTRPFDLVEVGEPQIVAFVARYLSVMAGIVAVALVYRLGRQLAGVQAGVFAAAMAALSPFWLAESQESRMYTLGFALLAAAAVCFWAMMDERQPANGPGEPALHGSPPTVHRPSSPADGRHLPFAIRPSQVAFIFLSALALLTHYNAVFILVAWYIWWGGWALLQPQRWRRLRTVFLSGLAMTLLVLPAAPIALRQIPGYANPNLTVPGVGEYLRQNWQSFVGGYAFDPALLGGNGELWLGAVLAVLLGGLLLVAVRHQATIHPAGYAFLLAWLAGGLVLYYVAVLDRGAFNPRYSSFVTPALYVLLGVALVGLGELWRWLPILGLLLILGGAVPASYADLTDTRFFREDTAGVANWLRAQAGPDDVIFVDQKYPFGFYYRHYDIDPGHSPLLDGPEAAPARYLFVDINDIDQRLTAWAGNARRVFWVQWYESDTDPRGAVTFLLDKYGHSLGEQRFQGYQIRWWQLDPPTTFHLAGSFVTHSFAFPPAVQTVAYSLPPDPVQAGDPLPVVIRWQRTTGSIDRPLKARVALYDGEGGRLAQDDRRILNDRHLAPSQWMPTDQPLNVYMVWLPDDLPAGRYELRLLVYDADSLDPLGMVDAAGNPAGLEPTLGTVTIR